jgi:hypothetical protein
MSVLRELEKAWQDLFDGNEVLSRDLIRRPERPNHGSSALDISCRSAAHGSVALIRRGMMISDAM